MTSMTNNLATEQRKTPYNSNYPKGGVSCSKDRFVVIRTLDFQIKFCGQSPAPRVATKRYVIAPWTNRVSIFSEITS